jgi:hypothetical protein
MIVPTIISLLKASNDVKSVVDDRIFPVAVPQKETRPSIVVSIGGNDPTESNKLGTPPVDIMNFVIYIEALSYADMDVLSQKIRTMFNKYRGSVIDTIRFNTMNDNEFDHENKLYSRTVIYTVRVHASS